jgi:hypothetical protein
VDARLAGELPVVVDDGMEGHVCVADVMGQPG